MPLEVSTTVARYLTWAPARVSLRFSPAEPPGSPIAITLRDAPVANGTGRLSFRAQKADQPQDTLTVNVPRDGTSVDVFVSGRAHPQGHTASKFDADVALEAVQAGAVVASASVMVRIRKNANNLDANERDRFLRALATLNARGQGIFQVLRDMHMNGTLREAHRDRGFLPWHRVYLLDLERRLQTIDPSVALPYWHFDHAAPNVFNADFMGVTMSNGNIDFSSTNPLDNVWAGDSGSLVLRRRPDNYDPAATGAMFQGQPVRSEAQAMSSGNDYEQFARSAGIERHPHDFTHASFSGLLGDPATAPTDPLFFLLHCNIDRLWAKWQNRNHARVDPANPASFFDSTAVGHRRGDTLWPWNNVTTPPRPSTAPGGGLPNSPTTIRPTSMPAVQDVIDWQGRLAAGGSIGYDYDDVSW